jgi:diguanylate cyclase (GGDEF)-like protein/PAS domain S-box-containing protein
MADDLHRVLARQLRKVQAQTQTAPDLDTWSRFLRIVHQTYADSDQDRYTLERSLILISEEMQDLYQRQKSSYENRLQTLFRSIDDLVWLKSKEGAYLSCNHMVERLFGAPEAHIIGKRDADFLDAEIVEKLAQDDLRAMTSGKQVRSEQWLHFADDGRRACLEIVHTPMYSESQSLIGVIGIAREITERKEALAEINRLAFYDPLTRLPNRRLLMDRLGQAIASAARSGLYGALFFIDLDNFKEVNDTLGHLAGDVLLVEVARRLGYSVREIDTVSRQGGDEFIVAIEGLAQTAMEASVLAAQVGKKLRAELAAPVLLNDRMHVCKASIGVCLFDGGDSIEQLFKHADLALYQAKDSGRDQLLFFDPAMQKALEESRLLEADLRSAVEKQELQLYYQLQLDAAGKPTGVEGLLRWRHPQRGIVMPGDFIPMAEETGLILPIGQWVLETACAQIRQWESTPWARHLQISVNVSAKQFQQIDFPQRVLSALASSKANPALLMLELTESMLVEDIETTIQKMQSLKEAGVQFSIDDFGTGYSSLSYLTQLPLDQIKIDKSFVRNIPGSRNDEVIARAIVAMGTGLGMLVTAEGIETQDQHRFFEHLGCGGFQGYLYSRPLSIDALEAFLAEN